MTKRLLFITPIFPKDATQDSVVPFISQFTQQFTTQTQVQIDVISLMYPFTTEKYTVGNVNVYPMGSGFKSFWQQIPYLLKAISKGKSLHRQDPYDGILCFWYRESALLGKVLSKWIGLRQIVWMLGQDIKKNNKYISLLQIPIAQLVMMSKQQSEFFFEYHGIRINRIANVAVNRNLFPELHQGHRNIDILGVGNLGALKNYSLFIELMASLKSKDFRAVIIGDGEEMDRLKTKTKQLRLQDNIHFLGAVSHPEVLRYMNQSKVFLHTSKSEGGGTVLQEALYSGCRVVSTIDMETQLSKDFFFFSTEKQKLADQINKLLTHRLTHQRIENFKMEDSLQVIYDCFYKD